MASLPGRWPIRGTFGFQALFPLSSAQEDSARHRIDTLINIVAELFERL